MEALVVCPCSHGINHHENGACAVPKCDCYRTRQGVLEDEIERLTIEHRKSRRNASTYEPLRG